MRRDRPAPPVRLVHLGLGNFFRAHQAWYTDRAPDAEEWGYAAFTGRRPDMADALTPQEGLYTLVTRARSWVVLVGERKALELAVHRLGHRRNTALPRRLSLTLQSG